ncbi:MAG: WD40/YVTN/BNR-like repeat-containing protein, partial [Ignavibacterium sp.]
MRIIYTIILLVLLAISFSKAQWQQINSGLPGSSVYGLAFDGQYTYAGTSIAGVYRSSNKGNNWISVNNGLPQNNAWELYSHNDTLFVGFFGPGAFRSTNHGNSWDTLFVGSSNSSV